MTVSFSPMLKISVLSDQKKKKKITHLLYYGLQIPHFSNNNIVITTKTMVTKNDLWFILRLFPTESVK